MSEIEATRANGFAEGRSADRRPHPIDTVVQNVIDRLPHATRLYPDVYAWQITDAVLADVFAKLERLTSGLPIHAAADIDQFIHEFEYLENPA